MGVLPFEHTEVVKRETVLKEPVFSDSRRVEFGPRKAVSCKNRGSEMPAKVTEFLFLEASKKRSGHLCGVGQ